MNNTSISVIIPFYNSIDTIERAVHSVLCQSLQPKEIIIIDDKSSETALSFVKNLLEKYSLATDVKLFLFTMESNGGAGEARNLGWSKASGEFIAFLDADDMWLPKKLEIQYSYFKNDYDLCLCGHGYRVVQNKNYEEELKTQNFNILGKNFKSKYITKRSQLLKNRFATSTVMIRNSIQNNFEDSKRYSEDFLLWSEIICSGKKSIKVNLDLTLYFKPIYGSSGLSSNMKKMFYGNLDSYRILYNKKFIGKSSLLLYTFLSHIKFARRLLIISFRKN